MPNEREKSNPVRPWRPRFSVRTLAVVVTLVCLYAACWEPTKRLGTQDVSGLFGKATIVESRAIAPLLIAVDETRIYHDSFINGSSDLWTESDRRYYFWCFGYVAKLPWEQDFSANNF